MIQIHKNYVEFLSWKEYGVKVFYTQKSYGNVMEKSREELQKDFPISDKVLITGKQTHSDHIVCVEEKTETIFFEDCDGFVTKRKDVVLFTKYADCMPVFLLDPKKEVIAVVHSGWKGSFQEISGKAVELMRDRYSCMPVDIQVILGIGISKERYEVGQDFFEHFSSHFSAERVQKSFEQRQGKIYFDNQEFIVQTLLEKGLLLENIVRNTLCTYQGNFHSYRRDREHSGRNGAFLYFESKDFHNK